MKEVDLPPRASALSQSMRDLGYSLETAIADIIDNSITAEASVVDVWCDASEEHPTLAIVDNGRGMDETTLVEAMRYGSRNPRDQRDASDLGRFGLGMKTASFSQCRKLTVVSRQARATAAAEWDLDRLAEDAWKIGLLDEREVRALPWLDTLGERGTMVLWRKLDRMSEQKSGSSGSALLNEKLARLDQHLSLVFHRFLPSRAGVSGRLSIRINGHPLQGFDPFCRGNKATQHLPQQHVTIKGHRVPIQAYVLPHHSMLSRTEYDFYRSRSDFISNQGAYVYRNDRLMAWGDWFRMMPKGETTKLARVEIDFPAELDEEWTIDIKKSRAHPPVEVREQLKQIIGRIAEQSRAPYERRGRRLLERENHPVWQRIVEGGRVKYLPSSEHPVIAGFRRRLSNEQKNQFDSVLEMIGSALPLDALQSDLATDPKDLGPENDKLGVAEIQTKLRQLHALMDDRANAEQFRTLIWSTRMFEGHEELIEEYIAEQF